MIGNYAKYPELYDEELSEEVSVGTYMKKQLDFMKMFQKLGESCVTRSVMASLAGAGMGLFFGMLSASLPHTHIGSTTLAHDMTNKEAFQNMFRGSGRRIYNTSKMFAGFSFWLSGMECIIEKTRGRSDIFNNMIAGCLYGGAAGIRIGPGPAMAGCAGFALFGLLIDAVFNRGG